MLVVWAYNFDDIIPATRDFEDKLIKFILTQRSAFASLVPSNAPSAAGSAVNLNLDEKATEIVTEKQVEAVAAAKVKKNKTRSLWSIFGYFVSSKADVEKSAEGPSARPIRLIAPFYGGFATALSICMSYCILYALQDDFVDLDVRLYRQWYRHSNHRDGLGRLISPLCPPLNYTFSLLCLLGMYTT